MAATIKIKNSSTAGAAPTSSDLVQGELAVNVTDKRLYTENSGGTVVELGTNPSVPVTFPDGSASAPSLTNDGDTNTGLFFPAADTIALTTGGTERARVDSSGNLGLAVTPSTWSGGFKAFQYGATGAIAFQNNNFWIGNNWVYNSGDKYIASDYATLYSQQSGQHQWYRAASGTAGNTITFTQAMTLDASGNLGLGATSPTQRLHLSVGTATALYTRIANSAGDCFIGVDSSGNTNLSADNTGNQLIFKTVAIERARIDSSGNLLVGTTSKLSGGIPGIDINNSAGGITFGVSGSSKSFVYTSPSVSRFITESVTGYTIAMISGGSNGVVLANGGTSWGSLSDERKKDIIEPITNAATKISTLRTVIGKYKSDEEGTRRAFLIAQDVQAVLPEAVSEDNGDLLLQYTDTIPLLVAAIKEQQAIITQLQADVAALKGQA